MPRIAIIGGHGKVALHLSRILAASGHTISSLIRNVDHSGDVRDTGARAVLADVENLDTVGIAEKLAGHDVVVWAAGAGGGNPGRTYTVDRDAAIRSMDAAEQADVSRYVMVSYLGAGTDHGLDETDPFFHYAEAKAAADSYLRGTALDWTILAPGGLTLDAATGRIDVGPELAGGTVSREDVAAVASAVLDLPGTIGKFIPFINGSTPIVEAMQRFR